MSSHAQTREPRMGEPRIAVARLVDVASFADRAYEDDGNLASRGIKGTVHSDPKKALAQCLMMIEEKQLISRHGNKVKVEVDTICLHGDEPTAVMVAGEVKKGLEKAGVKLVTLPEMLG